MVGPLVSIVLKSLRTTEFPRCNSPDLAPINGSLMLSALVALLPLLTVSSC